MREPGGGSAAAPDGGSGVPAAGQMARAPGTGAPCEQRPHLQTAAIARQASAT